MALAQRRLLFFILFVSGCAGSPVKSIAVNQDLPPDLLKEYRERFKVREGVSPEKIDPRSELRIVDSLPRLGRAPSVAKKLRQRSSALDVQKVEIQKPRMTQNSFTYPSRRPDKDPIWVGEKFGYAVKYLGVTAVTLGLEVLPFKTMAGRKVYHVRGTANTTPVFSIFHRMNDLIETFFDYEGNFSHRFHMVLDESKQKRDVLELYDSEKRRTFYWNRWHANEKEIKETKEFKPIEPFSQDTLSTLYYLRTVPLELGKVISFHAVSEGKLWNVVCTVTGREIQDTVLGKISTWVVKPEMTREGEPKKGSTTVWLTEDERKIPVMMEAKIKVGAISLQLRSAELGEPPGA